MEEWPAAFEWDDANVEHVSLHEFTPEEVEEVFAGSYRVLRTRQQRYVAFGATLDGRLSAVVFERRPKGAVRVVTAREMGPGERSAYRRRLV